MNLSRRLEKASELLLRKEVAELAFEAGLPFEEVYEQAVRIKNLHHLARSLPEGRYDIRPVVRLICAEDELDYAEVEKGALEIGGRFWWRGNDL